MIKRERFAEDRRLDRAMEVDRRNAMRIEEEIERKRKEERFLGALGIMEQIEENEQVSSFLSSGGVVCGFCGGGGGGGYGSGEISSVDGLVLFLMMMLVVVVLILLVGILMVDWCWCLVFFLVGLVVVEFLPYLTLSCLTLCLN